MNLQKEGFSRGGISCIHIKVETCLGSSLLTGDKHDIKEKNSIIKTVLET